MLFFVRVELSVISQLRDCLEYTKLFTGVFINVGDNES